MNISDLKVKLYADGASIEQIQEMDALPHISGFTTNPTLMRKAGVKDYEKFAREVLEIIPEKSVSFEVFADDFSEMKRQALQIASWGNNVKVKIPVTNTKRENSYQLIQELTQEGVKLNVTAIFTLEQVQSTVEALQNTPGAYVSVFAGRIADTGRDPIPHMKESLNIIGDNEKIELLWASPRELLNVVQADQTGCHIITATPDILKKLASLDKDLADFSLDTVKMFYNDASAAGYSF